VEMLGAAISVNPVQLFGSKSKRIMNNLSYITSSASHHFTAGFSIADAIIFRSIGISRLVHTKVPSCRNAQHSDHFVVDTICHIGFD
jgi:hypothetical protein